VFVSDGSCVPATKRKTWIERKYKVLENNVIPIFDALVIFASKFEKGGESGTDISSSVVRDVLLTLFFLLRILSYAMYLCR
jgi:hypothetical protein